MKDIYTEVYKAAENADARNAIVEAIIDSAGLDKLLYAITEVCYAKSEHLKANWQDFSSAEDWIRNARKVERNI